MIEKFDEYFKVEQNVIFERARFNKRNQFKGESMGEYLTTLCSELKDEMLRDRLVGIGYTRLSENLWTDVDLTLEKAKKKIRHKEAVQEQNLQLQSADQKVMEEVRKPPRPQHRSKGCPNYSMSSHVPRAQGTTSAHTVDRLSDKCPAKSAECHRCQGTIVANAFQ